MIASAAAAAFFSVAGSRLVPITAFAASSASSGVSDRLVRPIETGRDLAARHRQHDRGGRGGVVADLALEFFVGVAVTGRRHRDRDRGQEFAGLERGEIGALIEFGWPRPRARRTALRAGSSRPASSSAPACRCRDRHWRHCRRSCRGSAPADRRSAARSRAGSAAICRSRRTPAVRAGWSWRRSRSCCRRGGCPSGRRCRAGRPDAPGVASRSFIIGTRLWPPASGRASSPKCREQFDRIGDGRRPVIAEWARDHGSPPFVLWALLTGRGRWREARSGVCSKAQSRGHKDAGNSHEMRIVAHEMRQRLATYWRSGGTMRSERAAGRAPAAP